MPHLDGPGLYRALVRRESPLQHKLLFVTGDTMSPRTLEFLKSSGLPYLAKPFLVEELKEAVRQAVAAAPAAEEVAAGSEWPQRGCEGKMNFTSRTIFIISADSVVAQECIEELAAFGGRYRTPVASSIEQARKEFCTRRPRSCFSMNPRSILAATASRWNPRSRLLIETAPVVVAAAPEKQADLAF